MLCNKWNDELTKKLTNIADVIYKPEFSQSKGHYQQHASIVMACKRNKEPMQFFDPSEKNMNDCIHVGTFHENSIRLD